VGSLHYDYNKDEEEKQNKILALRLSFSLLLFFRLDGFKSVVVSFAPLSWILTAFWKMAMRRRVGCMLLPSLSLSLEEWWDRRIRVHGLYLF